jgi:hypothetical protein
MGAVWWCARGGGKEGRLCVWQWWGGGEVNVLATSVGYTGR